MICKRLSFAIRIILTKVSYNNNVNNLNLFYKTSVLKDLERFTGQHLSCSEDLFLKKILALI